MNAPLVKVENLRKLFPISTGFMQKLTQKTEKVITAVDGVDFSIEKSEILGLAGESGCGKTTTGKLLCLLETPTDGKIFFEGHNIVDLRGKKFADYRRRVQIVFQDPYQSLDPRYSVFKTISEPLGINKVCNSDAEKYERVCRALEKVELTPPQQFIERHPHELSGGQRQRVAVARSIVLDPDFVVADEPVSMLDVSVRAGVMNLFLKLRDDLKIAFLFISHDLSCVRYMSDKIAIMYLGKIVEMGSTDEIVNNPQHPYAQILLSAVPLPDPHHKRKRIRVPGELPNAIDIPKGCRFHPRCPYARFTCREKEPELSLVKKDHFVACSQ